MRRKHEAKDKKKVSGKIAEVRGTETERKTGTGNKTGKHELVNEKRKEASREKERKRDKIMPVRMLEERKEWEIAGGKKERRKNDGEEVEQEFLRPSKRVKYLLWG